MPSYKKFRITEDVLAKVEEKITKRVLANIEDIVASKCKEIFENHCGNHSHSGNDLFVVRQEIKLLKIS